MHRGFIQLLKLWLKLCSFRWLSPSRSLVIHLYASGLQMPNTELYSGRMNLVKLFMKILKLEVCPIHLLFMEKRILVCINSVAIHTSCCTEPSSIWQIFYKFFIFCDLLHKPSGQWNNCKIWQPSKIFVNIARGYFAITSSSLAHKQWSRAAIYGKNKKILPNLTAINILVTKQRNDQNEYFPDYLENITLKTRSHRLTQKRVLPRITWFSILLRKACTSTSNKCQVLLPAEFPSKFTKLMQTLKLNFRRKNLNLVFF